MRSSRCSCPASVAPVVRPITGERSSELPAEVLVLPAEVLVLPAEALALRVEVLVLRAEAVVLHI